ncbi:hypothetical protein HYDPIDRAFT_115909 [Hydnomerulius pinastri MD-312]|uniref:Uncharacterized protein n=1 Tax=Hydnomerulius pinastri MD-312 TaxID=994086 RepID=A0A0C9VTU6_9AGAM|nr:hypothetical protein HYDPIDRAFT_115909 [Hydnomerulius pinastri MD-312]
MPAVMMPGPSGVDAHRQQPMISFDRDHTFFRCEYCSCFPPASQSRACNPNPNPPPIKNTRLSLFLESTPSPAIPAPTRLNPTLRSHHHLSRLCAAAANICSSSR